MMSMKFFPPFPLKSAVLLITFNRLETTKQVLTAISEAKPPRLYIASDGPRKEKFGEEQKINEVREYVLRNINWDCKVKTLFSTKNLGCRFGPIKAIDWFFLNEEKGIILEDDCLPSLSFFWYCEDLLDKHMHDEKLFGIGGEQYLRKIDLDKEDYGFVSYPLIWGWATWRRAWKHFNDVPDECNDLQKHFPEKKRKKVLQFWLSRCNELKNSDVGSWDYQLALSMICNQALFAFPPVNLTSNIGFGVDATHTFNPNNLYAFRKLYDIPLPLKKNEKLIANKKYSYYFETNEFSKRSIFVKIASKINYFDKKYFMRNPQNYWQKPSNE